jgi:hypothetical protein
VKVLKEILRLRKQDKDERDEQEPCSTCISGPWRAPARREQRRHSARPEASFRSLKKLVFTAFQCAI